MKPSRRRRQAGLSNLFSSHMFDGSELPLAENLKVSRALLEECAALELILEVEAGVVGGEEDGVNNEGAPREKLYTTPEDMVAVAKALRGVRGGRYMFAATFGNVHGVYKPGNVKLKPTILRDGQAAVAKEYGEDAWGCFGAFCFRLENPVAFANPIPWKGQLGLFEVPDGGW